MARLSYISVTDKRFLINTLLKFQFDIMANNVQHDFDCIIIIDGEIEGSGKSVLAQQSGYYFSWLFKKPFTAKDNIAFTPQEFKDAVLNLPPMSAVVWDEAYQGANKYRIMSGINQTIQSLLQQIRQKNMVIIIVIPYFFDLTSYIAVPRSWFLLHVYLEPNYDDEKDEDINPLDFTIPMLKRGHFKFYSRKNKKQLYFRGKKEYNYSVARSSFVGLFPKFYTVDEQEYKDKKANIQTDESKLSERDLAIELIQRGMEIPDVSKWVNLSKVTLYSYKKKLIS